jgi:hypothetical protein
MLRYFVKIDSLPLKKYCSAKQKFLLSGGAKTLGGAVKRAESEREISFHQVS